VLGDLRAQLAACSVAERGFTALLQRYGGTEVRPYLDAVMTQAERMMREFIRNIPDGEYRFTDWIDGLGEVPEPLKIEVCLTVAADEIVTVSTEVISTPVSTSSLVVLSLI
jgi:N-methylhydantoinase B